MIVGVMRQCDRIEIQSRSNALQKIMSKVPRGGFDRLSMLPSVRSDVAVLDHTLDRSLVGESLYKIGVGDRVRAAQAVLVMRNAQLKFETLAAAIQKIGKRQRIGAAADRYNNFRAHVEEITLQTAVDEPFYHFKKMHPLPRKCKGQLVRASRAAPAAL